LERVQLYLKSIMAVGMLRVIGVVCTITMRHVDSTRAALFIMFGNLKSAFQDVISLICMS